MAVVISRSRWRFLCDRCLHCAGNAVPDSIIGYPDRNSYLRGRAKYASCACGGTFGWFPATVVHLESDSLVITQSWYS